MPTTTASAITEPRASAARTSAPPSLMMLTFASFVGLPSRLYSRNWYAPSTIPSATACAASAAARSGATLASVVATDVALRARRATAAPARRRPSSVSLSSSPTPTSTAAFALSFPDVGTESVSPRLASNPGLLEERLEPTVERGVDDVGARAEDAPGAGLRDRHREQFGRDAVGGCRDD